MKQKLIVVFMIVFTGWYACKDNDAGVSPPYDPGKSVELIRFFPDSGGISSKVIIEGENFGNDTSLFKVFFNQKKATVVNVQGNKAYVITPRLPGDTCTVTIKIGDKTMVFADKFRYLKQMTVTTVAGSRGANNGKFLEGPLSQAAFANIQGMCIDDAGNIFLGMRNDNGSCRVDVKGNYVYWLDGSNTWNSGVVDPVTQIAYLVSDGSGQILEINPKSMWIPRVRLFTQPTPEEIAQGKQTFSHSWIHGLAYCTEDSCLYTRQYQSGEIVKINPRTFKAECAHQTNQGDPGSDSYLAFDPLDRNYLYLSYVARHCIKRYNMKTHQFENFASRPTATPGWRDGSLQDAEFNSPRGIAFDKDGILYVADRNNHCIRSISRDGIVSTVAGIPMTWGTDDGDPSTARFDNPFAIAIDNEGNIFIGEDANNRMLRKLTIE